MSMRGSSPRHVSTAMNANRMAIDSPGRVPPWWSIQYGVAVVLARSDSPSRPSGRRRSGAGGAKSVIAGDVDPDSSVASTGGGARRSDAARNRAAQSIDLIHSVPTSTSALVAKTSTKPMIAEMYTMLTHYPHRRDVAHETGDAVGVTGALVSV